MRQEAAYNPNCPPHVLEELACDGDRWVRQQAAHNPNCPPHVLAKLAGDRNRFVRADAAANPNCPEPALEQLSEDSYYLVFSAARETLAQRRQQHGDAPPAPQEQLPGPKQQPTRAARADDSTADTAADGGSGGDETEQRERDGEGRCPS